MLPALPPGTCKSSRGRPRRLRAAGRDDLVTAVCDRARVQAEAWSGLPVTVYLVTAEEGVVCRVTD